LIQIGQQLGLTIIAQRGQTVALPAANLHDWRASAWQIVAAVAILVAGIVVLDSVLSAGKNFDNVSLRPKLLPAPPAPDEEAAWIRRARKFRPKSLIGQRRQASIPETRCCPSNVPAKRRSFRRPE
jgi:hypothetical protein